MLAFPGFTRSIIESLLDDDLAVHPMEFVMPRQQGTLQQRQGPRGGSAMARIFGNPTIKDGKYNLSLDMHQFKPEEVQVQMDDARMLKISGKREVKSEDGSSYELREYLHHFSLPEEIVDEMLSVKLDRDGHLSIQAPLKTPEAAVEEGVKTIPIEFVGKQ